MITLNWQGGIWLFVPKKKMPKVRAVVQGEANTALWDNRRAGTLRAFAGSELLFSSFHKQFCKPEIHPTKPRSHKTPDTKQREHPSARPRTGLTRKGPAAGIVELFPPRKRKTDRQEGAGPWWAVGLSPGLAVPLPPRQGWGARRCCWNVSPLHKIQYRPLPGEPFLWSGIQASHSFD